MALGSAFSGTLLLAGCASFSPDGGMDVVSGITADALNRPARKIDSEEAAAAARARTQRLLAAPLSADAAVQIALLNNRGLQAAYNELGIAEAVMVASSRPPAPSFSISNVSTSLELDIERQIVASILALATQPARSRIAADRFAQAQLQAALETLRVAAETRRAYYRAVAAREIVAALTGFKTTAETSAELAKQLGETGALNKLDQARQQVFYADVATELAAAHQRATIESERLVRLMGLWSDDVDFKLPGALPKLPGKPQTLPKFEQARTDALGQLAGGALGEGDGKDARGADAVLDGGADEALDEHGGLAGASAGGEQQGAVATGDGQLLLVGESPSSD